MPFFDQTFVKKSKKVINTNKKGNSEYSERHHIIPRCLGGSDHWDNLVNLYPEEHFVAHQLLVKIYKHHPSYFKLVHGATMMTVSSKTTKRINNKMYKWLKKELSEAVSKNMKGRFVGHLNPAKRPEVKEKMRKPKPKSKEGKDNIRKAQKKKDVSGQKNSFYGKTHSKESMKKMVDSRKSKNGNYHPNGHWAAKTFLFTSPTGEKFEIFNGAYKFANEKNINWKLLRKNTGKSYNYDPSRGGKATERTLNTIGWMVEEI